MLAECSADLKTGATPSRTQEDGITHHVGKSQPLNHMAPASSDVADLIMSLLFNTYSHSTLLITLTTLV